MQEAWQRCGDACGVVNEADWRLATTPPTTLAGVAAVLRFANEIEDGGMEWPATDAVGRAPRGRELSVREGLTRIIVDWSGSWQAARLGNWLGRSPATKAALGC